ncbi:NAD(P)-binding domain-containing protein [Fluviibacterium sp. DFM31]|uniref:NAD(P)-binding domain-containing protein n=1 Tax=Meridianimarinicoccus marinus TaxID=3231483 RepID=A0ABV3L973_9RHOB
MLRIHTLVIGAGQAGLAMSHCLAQRAIPHVVLERGEVANSWKSERWDSLRLLTPNWQNRLPGHGYDGPDPDGFMAMPDVIGFLENYASLSHAPVETGVRVTALTAEGGGYRVVTDKGSWQAEHVVVATGACNIASVPGFAHALPAHITQFTPIDYKTPAQLPPGGVLVVGGSATGVQLAAELRRAGHDVILSTGEHIRMPRHYRGRDIQWWMEVIGLNATRISEVDDMDRVRRLPSLQLAGRADPQFADLNALQALGIEITGRLATVQDGVARFSGALANHCALSDLKMNRLLDAVDAWAETTGPAGLPAPVRFDPTRVPAMPCLSLDLRAGRIATVLWATGYRPDYRWIEMPVFDRKGRLLHDNGAVAPGLHVLGLPFLRRRNSALIGGVSEDAGHIADRIDRTRHTNAA